jgi:sugar O-acyltransferase (sialic acid O-acetyltransferase NeuD family)
VVSFLRGKRFCLPSDSGRILIVGAGGFGREVLIWARDAWPDGASRIRGFLAESQIGETVPGTSLEVLGNPRTFPVDSDDAYILAIGVPVVRRHVAELLQGRGARFLTLVHPTAVVAPSASMGEGVVLCPYSVVSDSTRVGRFALINYHASLGHDSSIGDFAVLSPYATLGGGAAAEDDVFLGLHASIAPGRRVGAGTKVSANSAVLSDVPSRSIVWGVPGRASRRVDISD